MSQNQITTNASAATTAQPEAKSHHIRAFQIALGNLTGSENAFRLLGAKNDYNSRGNGSTMARRVLRSGSWEWLSAPASRNRYLAADRKDTQHGDVYEGEIVAEYTLGGNKSADAWYLIAVNEEGKIIRVIMDAQKTKAGYRLTHSVIEGEITVTDPYWK